MLEDKSKRTEVKCSWMLTQSWAVERPNDSLIPDGVLRFTQAICHLDKANCVPGRFAERSDCPNYQGRRHAIVIARKGQLPEELGMAIAVITE